MPGELVTDLPYLSGETLYALVLDDTGQVWNGTAFVPVADADWASYAVPMVEQGTTSGLFVGDMPAVATDTYAISVRHQTGAAPAVTDPAVATGTLAWYGPATTPGGGPAPPPTLQPNTTATTLYGVPLDGKRRAVVTQAGVATSIPLVLADAHNQPVNLDTIPGAAVACRAREAVLGGATYTLAVTVTAPDQGAVQVALPADACGGAGIYDLATAVQDGTGTPIWVRTWGLYHEPGLFAATPGGPPAVDDLRLHLRDSDPGENLLTDAHAFDTADLAAAAVRAVRAYNETNPPLTCRYSSRNFPDRDLWIDGAVAALLQMAAEFYRKNHLPHAAGGISVDDLGKARDFDQAAARRWEQYLARIRERKVARNMLEGFGAAGSEYGYGWWW